MSARKHKHGNKYRRYHGQTAHEIAEALEGGLPEGIVVGEDERKIISTVLDTIPGPSAEEFQSMKVDELREHAKALGHKVTTKTRKGDLLALLGVES